MEVAKLETLINICQRFNKCGVKYILCGAFASILHGVEKISKQFRPTKDYDFLIDGSRENVRRIKTALADLSPQINELRDDEFEHYTTVQIAERNAFMLDLIVEMWGVNYSKASKDTVIKVVEGVRIPVLSIDTLLTMKKDSFRPQDRFDSYWLKKIKEKK